ncbi:uncharacterized protein LOC120197152 [Hibiscus syriacus]|uniref:uncharacterized protein LOC120197152 n=1 Tax=Hibiscus syriacus TaxID=106335 RepID=UPI0019233037|nr:uncharacterized protein LOC120197152 [Hibiscus syriacus]
MDWRKLFGGSTNQNLDYFPTKLCDGIPTISPPSEIFEEGISEWSLSIVGQFLGVAPSFSTLHRTVETLWSKALLGTRLQVSSAGNNTFVFSFSSESARDWVLNNGPWHVHNKPLILRNWEPNLKRLSLNLSKIPVWVNLFNVPLELFSRTGLSYIASAIGVPISMDTITATKSRLEFAKVCIEIGVRDVIPKHIVVVLKNGQTTSITVEVPWLPHSCRRCNVFGHNEKGCELKTTTNQTVPLVWKKKTEHNPITTAIQKDNVTETEVNAKSKEIETEVIVPDQIQKLHYSNVAATKNKTEVIAAVSNKAEVTAAVTIKADIVAAIKNKTEDTAVVPNRDDVPASNLETVEAENIQPSVLTTGNGRQLKEVAKSQFSGSSNRFDLLNSVEENSNCSEIQRKPRAASLGVASLLKDLKSKKKVQFERAKRLTAGGQGGSSGLPSQ